MLSIRFPDMLNGFSSTPYDIGSTWSLANLHAGIFDPGFFLQLSALVPRLS